MNKQCTKQETIFRTRPTKLYKNIIKRDQTKTTLEYNHCLLYSCSTSVAKKKVIKRNLVTKQSESSGSWRCALDTS